MVRLVSNELRQIFRAYTKQLRGEYTKASKGETQKESLARGYEQVDISDEARALAAAESGKNEPDEASREEPGREKTIESAAHQKVPVPEAKDVEVDTEQTS